MKPKSLQGYTVALAFLEEYQTENELKNELATVKMLLQQLVFTKVSKIARQQKKDFKKVLLSISEKGWIEFEKIAGKDTVVSCLKFVLQLISKNPDRDKHKMLTSLSINLESENRFSRDEDMVNARDVVNRFYELT